MMVAKNASLKEKEGCNKHESHQRLIMLIMTRRLLGTQLYTPCLQPRILHYKFNVCNLIGKKFLPTADDSRPCSKVHHGSLRINRALKTWHQIGTKQIIDSRRTLRFL